MAIILQMRERMEEMQHQMQDFITYMQKEMLAHFSGQVEASRGAIVPIRRAPPAAPAKDKK